MAKAECHNMATSGAGGVICVAWNILCLGVRLFVPFPSIIWFVRQRLRGAATGEKPNKTMVFEKKCLLNSAQVARKSINRQSGTGKVLNCYVKYEKKYLLVVSMLTKDNRQRLWY